MSGQRKTTVSAARTYFRVFVSGANINDAVRSAAAHVKDAGAEYCAAHGIEPERLTVNLHSVLPVTGGHKLTYVMGAGYDYE